jgi:SAM-dependent methyltransferase
MSKARAERLEAAKQAVAVKDWYTARQILAPLVAQDPYGVSGFLLARAEFELGRPEAAVPLVKAFRATRPNHVGSAMLAARLHLAAGDLAESEKLARLVLAVEPANEVAPRLLERIAAAAQAKQYAGEIATIDGRYLEVRNGDISAELLVAARTVHDVSPGPDWVSDTEQAKVAYFHHAKDVGQALISYDPELIDVSTRFDFLSWPKRIQEHLGDSVLDVGCGFGGLGMGYLVAGASSYTGVDPALELDSTRARNKRARRWDDMGVTPRQIAATLPAINLVQSEIEAVELEPAFDTIVLHNVSEHLSDLDQVLAHLTSACHSQSRLVLLHHNFYCWNGHKRQPRWPGQIDASNRKHQQIFDWRHINAVSDLPADHDLLVNLNRLRLDELRAAVERHYVVTHWEELPSDDATCARLTPEILDRVREVVPDITERDLTVNSVFCVAGPKN